MVWKEGKQLQEGQYIIQKPLGSGGFAITYLAKNKDGANVAIKTLDYEEISKRTNISSKNFDKFKKNFMLEGQRLCECIHPHIVRFYTLFNQEKIWCMSMEYVEGEDLETYIQNVGILSEKEALSYLRQIGDALTLVHSKEILHRDVKPKNIMLRASDSTAVLIDFGIAREFKQNQTQKMTVSYTDGFAPIEQYSGENEFGPYTDLYGLAATLYFLLTAEVPKSALKRKNNQLLDPSQDPLIPPKELNPNISDIVNQAILEGLALEPKDRPQSIQQWLHNLDKAIDNKHGVTILSPKNPPEYWLKAKLIYTLSAHSKQINSLVFGQDGKTLISASSDHTIKLWNSDIGQLLHTFAKNSDVILCIAISPDGKTIVTGDYQYKIKLWDVETNQLVNTISRYAGQVLSVAISPDGKILASSGLDGSIKTFDLATGNLLKNFGDRFSVSSISSHHVNPICISPDGKNIISGSFDNKIKIWDINTGKEIRTLQSPQSFWSTYINSVTISPDQKIIASNSCKDINIWNFETGQLIYNLSGHCGIVYTMSISPCGQILASGSEDHTIKLWNLNTGKIICTFDQHKAPVYTVIFRNDGQVLVSGSGDNTIEIWRVLA